MGEIDRKRVTAVKVLEGMGCRFDGQTWYAPHDPAPWPEADALHALLMDRVEALAGCIEDPLEEDEPGRDCRGPGGLEVRRWPRGKVEGGKG